MTVRVHHMHMSASADMCALKFVERVHPQGVFIAPHFPARSVVTSTSMEVMQFILQEFVQNRTIEQIVVPVGHGVEV